MKDGDFRFYSSLLKRLATPLEHKKELEKFKQNKLTKVKKMDGWHQSYVTFVGFRSNYDMFLLPFFSFFDMVSNVQQLDHRQVAAPGEQDVAKKRKKVQNIP